MPSGRVLITGGAGFLGAHLTACFREHGICTRSLDVAERPDWACSEDMEYLRADIRDPAAIATALRGVDTVVHAAFASPRQSREAIRSVNVEATRELCAATLCGGISRFILISSTIVLKPRRVHPLSPNSPLTRLDLYRESRAEAERVVMGFAGRGLRVAIARPKTFLGPGRVGAFAIIFDCIRRGSPVPVLGSGGNRYQLLHIRDMAEGIRLLHSADAEGVFFFGARNFGAVREDLQALLDHAQSGSKLRFLPGQLVRPTLRAMELCNLVPLSEWHQMSARGQDSVVDISRAEHELGWRPEWSNVQALVEAYDWYVASLASTGLARSAHPVPLAHKALRRLLQIFLR